MASLWRYARIRLEVQQYLLMKTVVSLVMGVLSGLGVWMIGLDFPVLWGLLASVSYYGSYAWIVKTNTGAVLVEVENLAHLQKIMKAARRVKGVTEVARRERLTES